MIESSFEREVKEVYPDAICDEFVRLDVLYRIKHGGGYIGEWSYTIMSAWESACKEIKSRNYENRK